MWDVVMLVLGFGFDVLLELGRPGAVKACRLGLTEFGDSGQKPRRQNYFFAE